MIINEMIKPIKLIKEKELKEFNKILNKKKKEIKKRKQMFWTKTIKQIKDLQTSMDIKLNEIAQTVYIQKYQIKNLELDNKIWTKILDKKLKEIVKIQKEEKKKNEL